MATIQVSGLSSGLDTENIVQQLMAIERKPVDMLAQRKTDLELEESAWGDVRLRLTNLVSTLAPLRLSSTFTSKAAGSSDPAVVTATASPTAQTGTYTMDRIDKLASAHKVASDVIDGNILEDSFTGATKIDPANSTAYVDYAQGLVKLGSGAPYTGPKVLESVNVTTDAGGNPLNLTKFRFYASDDVPAGTAINYYYSTDDGTTWTLMADPGPSGTEITLGVAANQLKFKAEFTTTDTGSTPVLYDYRFEDLSATFEGTFKINAKEITVPAGTTSLTLIRDLINQANAGVTASVLDNRLVITSNITGAGSAITFADDPDTDILTELGILDAADAIKNEIQPAQDAELYWDGLLVKRSTNTVADLISGVTLELHNTSATPVTVSVSYNTQQALDAINAFVEQYNSTVDFLATKMGKDVNDNPLELFGDPTAVRVQQELKRLATDLVSGLTGSYQSLADVGLTTTDLSQPLGFDAAGKLQVDSAQLAAALVDDPEAVMALFNSNTPSAKGVATRLYSYTMGLVTYGTGIIYTRENLLQTQVLDVEEQINRWEERLMMVEERLYRQFTALETALSAMQAQSTWLSQQLLNLPGAQATGNSST